MSADSRYRIENGVPCVDVKADSVERLFDNRDPAPFRERDLDPDLVEYLKDAMEDLGGRKALRIVFWIEKECALREIEDAFRAHFTYELERLLRARRRQRATGTVGLVIAFVVIGALLTVAPLIGDAVGGWFGTALREGLVIASWVLMWRPVDELLYDWIPYRRERAAVKRLLAAPLDLRAP